MAKKMQNKFVAESTAKLYLNSRTADVHFTFTIDGETIKVPAHKANLAVASPVFDAMFFGSLKEGKFVEMVDVSASAFEEFLQLFYLPEVTLTMENIEAVARWADKYDMLKHVDVCAEFLQGELTEDDMLWGYELAISLNNQNLKQFCESQIRMLTSDAFKSDIFLHCGKSVVEHILRLELLVCGEFDLFMACIEWAKWKCRANYLDEDDPNNRREQLGDCFYLIRFETLGHNEMCMILENKQHRQLFSREELADIFCMTSNKLFESEIFKHTQRSLRRSKWNTEVVLTCELIPGASCHTREKESTWFTVNVPVLLGGIMYDFVYDSTSGLDAHICFKISIVEYNRHTFKVTNASKVLYSETTTFSDKVVFLEPIVVHPEMVYEIRFEAQIALEPKRYNHFSYSKFEYKLDEEVTIKFYRNPSEHGSAYRGLVKRFYFNRI